MKSHKDWIKGVDYPNYMSKSALVTLRADYLQKGKTPRETIENISRKVELELGIDGIKEDVFNCIWNGWIGLSSPIWSNFGTRRGLPISCFNSHISDSIFEFKRKDLEIAIMSKNGGGTSAYLGDVRPLGAEISNTSAKARGCLSPIKMINNTIEEVSQGGVRRGMLAAYLDFSHGDIMDFLEIRKPGNPIQTITNAVVISDEDIQNIINGDKYSLDVWAKILESRNNVGTPYILFKDNANKHKSTPIPYRSDKYEIKSSNLCLVGDTMVTISLSETGENEFTIRMDDLNSKINSCVYKDVYVKSYKTSTQETIFSKISRSFLTGYVDGLIEIETDNGNVIKCTPDHEIYTKNRGYVKAKDLLETDELVEVGSGLIKSITGVNLIDKVPVYDITVPETSNFYANDVVVHNCSEITLPSSQNESFVCCLASMNLALYDEWKNTNAVKICVYILEAVMNEFIRKASAIGGMEDAVRFAERHRALGIGTLGEHSYLQSKMIPFVSLQADTFRRISYKQIKTQADDASKELADMFGACEVNKEFGIHKRHTTMTAIAPTTTNALICGDVSPGIEPWVSNVFQRKVAKGSFLKQNPELLKLLKEKEQDLPEVWDSITENFGSVQHLDFLSDEEKEVFLTAYEISQFGLIKSAAIRQMYIDQSQSLNLFILPSASPKLRSTLYLTAAKYGIKSLYYQRSLSNLQEGKSQESVNAYFNKTTDKAFDSSCVACEG